MDDRAASRIVEDHTQITNANSAQILSQEISQEVLLEKFGGQRILKENPHSETTELTDSSEATNSELTHQTGHSKHTQHTEHTEHTQHTKHTTTIRINARINTQCPQQN